MAEVNTNATAEITKRVYGENFEKLQFDAGIVGELIPFKSEKKIGDTYRFPIALTFEQGTTYNGTAGSVVTLADAISATVKQADVAAYEFIMRSKIGYRLMMDAISQGEAAYENSTRMVMETLQESAEIRREASLLYGQEGLGVVSSNASGVLTITAASWSSGTWENQEGAILEAWTGVSASETQHNGDLTITAIDHDAKTVTVTGTSAAVVANDVLYFKGARTASAYNEMAGLHKIIANTGIIFGLSASTYSRWRGNTKSSMGQVNFEKFLSGISKLSGRRVRKKSLKLLMPPAAYEVINADLTSARRFDGSYSRSKGSQGFETIEFYGQTGMTSIMVHPMLRDGDSMAFTDKNGIRIGSTDLTFDIGPGGAGDVWFHNTDKNSMEVRCIGIQAPVFQRPSETILFSGQTYT